MSDRRGRAQRFGGDHEFGGSRKPDKAFGPAVCRAKWFGSGVFPAKWFGPAVCRRVLQMTASCGGLPNTFPMRVWTIPNLVSFARLAGVPVVIWLGLSGRNDFWLFLLFVASGVTDWLDGYLARKLNQYSDLGMRLDPLADRLYIVAALIVLFARQLVPTFFLLLIVLRELAMALLLLRMRSSGFAPPAVHYIGKAGTMMLLYSIPLIFLGAAEWPVADLVSWFALSFMIWGVVTYWYAAFLYLRQYRQEVRHVH